MLAMVWDESLWIDTRRDHKAARHFYNPEEASVPLENYGGYVGFFSIYQFAFKRCVDVERDQKIEVDPSNQIVSIIPQ